MNQLSPTDLALKAELGRAIRRDQQRRERRRRSVRLGAVSALGVAALSSAALAAGGAFKTVETVTPVAEVELPKDVTIQAVDSFPEFVGRASSNGFVTKGASARWGQYIYHVTGGEAPELGCGGPGVPTNNIYITSTRALSEQEIEALLQPDGELVWPVHKQRPPWVTQTSDGCPNPGVAGQPGTPGWQPPVPDKASVATPTSKTPSILVHKRTVVPIAPSASPAPTQTTTTGATPTTTTGATSPPTKTPSAPTGTPAPGQTTGATTPAPAGNVPGSSTTSTSTTASAP